MNVSAVILAGGESRRMGSDKAFLQVRGTPLISLMLSKVRESAVREVFISGRAGADYSKLDCPVVFDLEPGLGPLSGIERGLAVANSSLVLFLAVDMPHMTPAFVRKLISRCDDLTGVVPKVGSDLEPLAAIYPKRCHAIAVGLHARFCGAAREFANACLREGAVRSLPVAERDACCFSNWNRVADVDGPDAIQFKR